MRDSKLPTVLQVVVVMMLVLGQFGACASALESGLDLNRPSDVNTYVDELTGFGELAGVSKILERVDINDDNTPFLHTQINGKKGVWCEEVRNIRLKLKSASPSSKDKYVRAFKIFIDPNGGHLLKITSIFDGNDPNMLPEPPAAIAEAQIKGSGELYHGFPALPSEISFLEALDSVLSKGMGSPFLAEEIYGLYVLHSWSGSQPRPSWVITLRGLHPAQPLIGGPPHRQEEDLPPVWQRNHIRNVVDAVTGDVGVITTAPQPLPPREEEK